MSNKGRIKEQFGDALKGTRVDREKRMIYGVSLCGSVSKNGYRYSEQCLKEAAPKYSRRAVFLDHDPDRDTERSVRDLAGIVLEPRYESERLRGDIQCLANESGNTLLCLAETVTSELGMSHVAEARRSDDGSTVEEIIDVISVDAVFRPATTGGIFESHKEENVKITVKTLMEQHKDDPAFKPLREKLHLEDAGMDPAALSVDTPATGASSEEQAATVFRSMILAVLDGTGSVDEKADKLKKLLGPAVKAADAITNASQAAADAAAAETTTAEESAKAKTPAAGAEVVTEGAQGKAPPATPTADPKLAEVLAENARLKTRESVRALFAEKGVPATDLDVEACCGLAEDKRKAFVERLALVTESTLESTGPRPRTTGSEDVRESYPQDLVAELMG